MATRERYWETKPGRYSGDAPVEMLTAAGRDYLLKHQCPPPREAVRADSAGLRMITTKDHSDRPIYTFELPAGATKRSAWMGQFMAQPQLQIRINKSANPPGSAEAIAFEDRWRENQRQMTTGQYTLPEF